MGIHGENIQVVCTESFDLESIVSAWRYSRPNDTDTKTADILNIDAPVNEFTHASFQVFVPVILREWLCSWRDHIVWARTSRVDDLNEWPIWLGIYADHHSMLLVDKLHEAMIKGKESGQDQFRMNLPICYMTHLSLRLSLRGFVKLCSSLAAEHERGGHFGNMCIDLARRLYSAVNFTKPEHATMVGHLLGCDAYGVETICPRAPDVLLRDYSERLGGFVVVSLFSVPIALRAQLVRHRPLMIRDNLRDFFDDPMLTCPISTPMHVEAAMTIETANSILKKRNCWIAQADLWAPFVNQARSALGIEGNALPCDDRPCPYEKDNRLRIADKDPGAPCPRFAKLNDEPLNYNHTVHARAVAEQRPDRDFWVKELLT